MLGILSHSREKLVYNPSIVELDFQQECHCYFKVDGKVFMEHHATNANQFLSLKKKYKEIYEDFINFTVRVSDYERNYIFDLSLCRVEV